LQCKYLTFIDWYLPANFSGTELLKKTKADINVFDLINSQCLCVHSFQKSINVSDRNKH